MNEPVRDAHAIFEAALATVDPFRLVEQSLNIHNGHIIVKNFLDKIVRKESISKFNKILIIGYGKASVPMAAAVECILDSKLPKLTYSGAIITVSNKLK